MKVVRPMHVRFDWKMQYVRKYCGCLQRSGLPRQQYYLSFSHRCRMMENGHSMYTARHARATDVGALIAPDCRVPKPDVSTV